MVWYFRYPALGTWMPWKCEVVSGMTHLCRNPRTVRRFWNSSRLNETSHDWKRLHPFRQKTLNILWRFWYNKKLLSELGNVNFEWLFSRAFLNVTRAFKSGAAVKTHLNQCRVDAHIIKYIFHTITNCPFEKGIQFILALSIVIKSINIHRHLCKKSKLNLTFIF